MTQIEWDTEKSQPFASGAKGWQLNAMIALVSAQIGSSTRLSRISREAIVKTSTSYFAFAISAITAATLSKISFQPSS